MAASPVSLRVTNVPKAATTITVSGHVSVEARPSALHVLVDNSTDTLTYAGFIVSAVTLFVVCWQMFLMLQRPRLFPSASVTVKQQPALICVTATIYAHNNGASPANNILIEWLCLRDDLDSQDPGYKVAIGDPTKTRKIGASWYVIAGAGQVGAYAWLFPNTIPFDLISKVSVPRDAATLNCLLRLYDPYRKYPRWSYYAFTVPVSADLMQNVAILPGPADDHWFSRFMTLIGRLRGSRRYQK